jgi:hypothetical protein
VKAFASLGRIAEAGWGIKASGAVWAERRVWRSGILVPTPPRERIVGTNGLRDFAQVSPKGPRLVAIAS